MKNISFIFFSFFALALFLSACGGGGGRPSERAVAVHDTAVEVERGPVYNAIVVDAKNNIAKSEKINSDRYIFDSTPIYPITAKASSDSWIDIDGDGNRTTNDITLDINMTSYTNVITPITTILSDANKTRRDKLANKLSETFDIPLDDLNKTPSSSNSSNMAILTNAIYKKVKELHTSIKTMFNYNTLIKEGNTTLKNIYNNLKNAVDENSSLYTNGQIDALKIEKYLYDTNKSLFTRYKLPSEVLDKEVFSTDEIEKIWNIGFKIDNTKEYKEIKIGIEINKYNDDGSISRGEFVYSGVNITKSSVVTTRIDIWGKTKRQFGGTWIDKDHNSNGMLQKSISLDSDTLTLNIGSLIKSQTQVSESTFREQAKYSITVVSSSPIFKTSSTKTLSLVRNKFNFVNKQGISGEITIK